MIFCVSLNSDVDFIPKFASGSNDFNSMTTIGILDYYTGETQPDNLLIQNKKAKQKQDNERNDEPGKLFSTVWFS